MEEINIRKENSKYNEKVIVLRISGRLDAKASDYLEQILDEEIKNKNYFIILDLKDVNYLGSSTIRVFLGMRNKIDKNKGFLRIINMPSTGLKIIKAMEIEDKFDIYELERDAAKT